MSCPINVERDIGTRCRNLTIGSSDLTAFQVSGYNHEILSFFGDPLTFFLQYVREVKSKAVPLHAMETLGREEYSSYSF
jgi:hypothetical protein